MKILDIDQLARLFVGLHKNPRVVVSGNMATPMTALGVLDQQVANYRLWALNAHAQIPLREGVVPETPFVGPGMRRMPHLRYLPCRLSLVPALFRSATPPDVVLIHTTTPVNGSVSLGLEVNVIPAAIEAVKARGGIVVAQMNPLMPFTYGDALIPVQHIDYGVEVAEPLRSALPRPPDAVSAAIGERIAHRINSGATLQMGIGAVPDAVLAALTDRRGLRIWTEMFSDGVLALHKAGALDADHPLVTSFLFGSPELYEWVDRNQGIRMLRTERTNDPAHIMLQRRMTSVNSALQVDLHGQANASRIRGQIYSGFGGQTDFIVGALHAHDGQAIIAMRSWQEKAGVSTIVPALVEPVTSFQQTAVVTEQGAAELWGRSEHEQAVNLIEHAAHPDAREELRMAAKQMGLS